MSETVVNPFNNSKVSVTSTGTSSSGTKITTKAATGGAMDKTAFLKILAAEMSNLDPTQEQDSTAYVTQMAQFASMEQMTNLNSTMTKFSYEQLLGKGVVLTDTDSSGNAISGTVEAVQTDASGNTYLNVTYESNGSYLTNWFSANNISAVSDTSTDLTNASAATTALNTSFATASALKGQDVVVSTTDVNDTDKDKDKTETIKVSGTVKSVYIKDGVVMIKVTTEDGTTEEYPYSSVVQAGDLDSSTTNSTATTASNSTTTTGSNTTTGSSTGTTDSNTTTTV